MQVIPGAPEHRGVFAPEEEEYPAPPNPGTARGRTVTAAARPGPAAHRHRRGAAYLLGSTHLHRTPGAHARRLGPCPAIVIASLRRRLEAVRPLRDPPSRAQVAAAGCQDRARRGAAGARPGGRVRGHLGRLSSRTALVQEVGTSSWTPLPRTDPPDLGSRLPSQAHRGCQCVCRAPALCPLHPLRLCLTRSVPRRRNQLGTLPGA